MNKIYNCIYNLKRRNNENIFFLLLKIAYKIFSNQTVINIINVLLPFVFSLPIFGKDMTIQKRCVICLVIVIVLNVLWHFTAGYKIYSFTILKGSENMIENINSLFKTYNEKITDNTCNGLFELISDSTCRDLYHYFRDVYNIETRISLIQQYIDENSELRSIMISRTSKRTQNLGRPKYKSKVCYDGSQKYYNKILIDGNSTDTQELVIFFKEDIDKHFKYSSEKSKKRSKIQQYISFPQKAYGKNIAFILQIDVLEKNGFGKTIDEVEDFCEKNVDPFIRILQNAYLVEIVKKQEN